MCGSYPTVHSDDEDEILTSMNEMNERGDEDARYQAYLRLMRVMQDEVDAHFLKKKQEAELVTSTRNIRIDEDDDCFGKYRMSDYQCPYDIHEEEVFLPTMERMKLMKQIQFFPHRDENWGYSYGGWLNSVLCNKEAGKTIRSAAKVTNGFNYPIEDMGLRKYQDAVSRYVF